MNPNDIRDLETLRRVAAERSLDYLFFWGHSGNRDKAWLSQWHPTSFEVDGVRYATAEHYMMERKARLFEDEDMAAQIIEAPTPAAAKKLGRKVRDFVDEVWKAHRFEIVKAASLAKFAQHDALRAYLCSTHGRILVEAAPRDRIWGIGMGASNPKATDPAAWRGLNLLGFALMAARADLMG